MTPINNPARPSKTDDELAALLAAYDDAAGGFTPATHAPPWDHLDPVARARLEQDKQVLDLLDELWPRSAPPPMPTPIGAGVPFTFGRFRARKKIGAGGCGVVFLADDPVLRRKVALKIPRPEVLGSPDLKARFLREAQTAAVLSHPNIVPVYEASEVGGVCYIASEYCPGPTLAQWLLAHPGPVAGKEAAAMVAAVADAMGYAHRRRIVHRDLKPSNILLTGLVAGDLTPPPGTPLPDVVPMVTDFGFAKLLERQGEEGTRSGTVIGTPQYMAPEQAEGDLDALGPHTDVYALGTVLYEMITGKPAVKGETDPATLALVVSAHPARPRAVYRYIAKDLEAVCLKCLEKNPADRYANGDALAADLWRFMGNEPTKARPCSTSERVWKACRRNPTAVALCVAAAAGLLAAAVMGVVYNHDLADRNDALDEAVKRERGLARDADAQRLWAIDRTRAAGRQTYLAQVRYAGGLARAGRPVELPTGWDDADDIRGFEWHYLARLGRAAQVWRGFPGAVTHVALSADGSRAAAAAGGEIRAWATADPRRQMKWPGFPAPIALAVSPDGRAVAARTAGGLLRVLDADTGTDRFAVPDAGESVEFYPDGRLLVSHPNGVRAYDPDTGDVVADYPTPGRPPAAAAPAPGGAVAYFAGGGFGSFPGSGAESPAAPDGPFADLAASADGRFLAARRTAGGHLRVFNRETNALAARVSFGAEGAEVYQFRPDGRLAAARWGDGDSAAQLRLGVWDPADPVFRELRAIEPGCKIRSVALGADGRRIIVGGVDQTVRLIDTRPPPPAVEIDTHSINACWGLAYAPDGRKLVTTGDGMNPGTHLGKVWDTRTRDVSAVLRGHDSLVTAAAFFPDSARVLTGSFDGTVRVWDAATGEQRLVVRMPAERIRAIAVSPNGKRFATAGDSGLVRVWDAASGAPVFDLVGHVGRMRAIIFTPNGRHIITAGVKDNTVRWWDAAAGAAVRVVPEPDKPGCLALSPDGKTLAVGSESGAIVYRDAETGAEKYRGFAPPKRLIAAAFCPQGKTLATGGTGGAVRLWHATTGEELLSLCEGGPTLNGLAFSPDGKTLAATREDGKLVLWPTE